ncbi:metallophosphoesterase [Bacillus manliponensis]|uniref:Metallophosphoesterase n=1 Tax=Bacillus manliponensis TaxID=574376 RepID=A0A073JZ02_9BACI|nr:lasso peptide biosynthesis PqqD family chaperone [Bacillus manliponensis]KEK20299.1 metallophosphoesterase [Bacillus manliponensis]
MINLREVSLSSIVAQCEGNIVSDMDGETVMMSVENGKYYNLGKIGGAIWNIMKEPVSIEQVVTILMSEYDVEREDCEEQVRSFLIQLYEEDLICIKHKD